MLTLQRCYLFSSSPWSPNPLGTSTPQSGSSSDTATCAALWDVMNVVMFALLGRTFMCSWVQPPTQAPSRLSRRWFLLCSSLLEPKWAVANYKLCTSLSLSTGNGTGNWASERAPLMVRAGLIACGDCCCTHTWLPLHLCRICEVPLAAVHLTDLSSFYLTN